MKFSTTLILLIIATGLLGYLFYIDKDKLSTREKNLPTRFLIETDPKKIDEIIITKNDEKALFKRNGTLWNVFSPYQDRADQEVLQSILTWATSLTIKEIITPTRIKKAAALSKDFGFSQDKILLHLNTRESPVAALEIGHASPLHDTLYVRFHKQSADKNIYIVDGNIRSIIEKPFSHYVDKKLFSISNSDEATRILIKNESTEIDILKNEETKLWEIKKPLHLHADQEKMEEVITSLFSLTALEVIHGENSFNPKAGAIKSIEIRAKGISQGSQLFVEKPTEDNEYIFARVSDRKCTFKLPKEAINILNFNVNDLRSKHLLLLHPPSIRRIVFDGNTTPIFSCVKENGVWSLQDLSDDRKPVNTAKIESFFETLTTAKIKAFIADTATDLSSYGLDKPFLSLTFISHTQEQQTLLFGENKEEIFTTVKGTSQIKSIDPSLLTSLVEIPPHPYHWQSLHVLNFSTIDLKQITLKSSAQKTPLTLNYSYLENKWEAFQEERNITDQLDEKKPLSLLLFSNRSKPYAGFPLILQK